MCNVFPSSIYNSLEHYFTYCLPVLKCLPCIINFALHGDSFLPQECPLHQASSLWSYVQFLTSLPKRKLNVCILACHLLKYQRGHFAPDRNGVMYNNTHSGWFQAIWKIDDAKRKKITIITIYIE